MTSPFISFITFTYKRPQLLAKCLASVWNQTAVTAIEHLIIADHVGVGVGGVYDRLPDYASAVHGRYVHILADDDELGGPTVVEDLRTAVNAAHDPPLVLCRSHKGIEEFPSFPRGYTWPPQVGQLDLGCIVTRTDVWRANLAAYDGKYWGDYLFLLALARQGIEPVWVDRLFVVGAVMYGRAERGTQTLEKWTRARVGERS